MTNLARAPFALSLAAILGCFIATPTHAVLVEDLGVRTGKPVHISLSTGFNGVVAAGIKSLRVDGVVMDGFCIDPFTRALSSSSGYSYVPLTQAPEAPWTLSPSEATQISDLWAMFYSPSMKKKKAAGLQIAIWEIVGGSDFSVVGKQYGASKMLAALGGFTGQGADLIALTGPGQDYVVPTPPGQGPEVTPTPGPSPSPPPTKVPDSGSTFPLFATAVLVLLALNTSCLPGVIRARATPNRM
jgi:VPDSG-CTERM motif